MREKFSEQLTLLNNSLIEMGCFIEHAITMAIKALIEQNTAIAEQVIAYDDEIDAKEKDIESLCIKLLLQQQPVAKDLRLISAALKMITDMERIGDQSADISEIAILLADKQYIKKLEHIPKMAGATKLMVRNAVDAFVKKDLELAYQVIQADDEVDDLFDLIKKELIALILKDPQNGEQAIDLMMIAKYFERIGDHAVNIAEWVVFSLTGKNKFGKTI